MAPGKTVVQDLDLLRGRMARRQSSPSWEFAATPLGCAPRFSMAPAPLKASCPISTSTVPASTIRPPSFFLSRSSLSRNGFASPRKVFNALARKTRSTSVRCTGGARRPVGSGARSRFHALVPGNLRSAHASPHPDFPPRFPGFAVPLWSRCRSMPKAGCLYPNNARALFEARERGFDNAVMCDPGGQRR